MKRRLLPFVALLTLGSGLLNVYSVLGRSVPHRVAMLRYVFPLEFLRLSRWATLLIGLALVISSLNIYKRKVRAWWAVLSLSLLSALFHLTKGIDYEEASLSMVLAAALWLTRRNFTVHSRAVQWRGAVVRLAVALAVVLAYGIGGFWLLDPREFGVNFHWREAVIQTFRYLTLAGDPSLQAHTHYAHWFLESLYVIAVAALAYSGVAVFRPVLYRFGTHPHEAALARQIVAAHGRSSHDFFKARLDKSLFFSPTRRSFLAYRVGASFAVVLGDPVGPEEEIEALVRAFLSFCRDNDWGVGFHQVLPDFLPVYGRLGLKRMKIGDDAIVDLPHFSLESKPGKAFRSKVSQLEKAGIRTEYQDPPIAHDWLSQMKEVSDEWLQIPGRRERQFSLGVFDPDYLRQTPVFLAADGAGRVLAFVNIIPSYHPGEATIDLMRRRSQAPNGIMDYLLVKLLLRDREQGFARFNLGMAPMAGFQEKEAATPEERAVHAFFQHLNFAFSFRGLRAYKAKFATRWEPRYVIYRHVLELPRLVLALGKVSEPED